MDYKHYKRDKYPVWQLMVGEHVFRYFRFPDLGIPDPQSTVKIMITNGREIWMDVQGR